MRILVVIGTRPEAIKLAPVIRRFQESGEIDVRICLTGQHRELLAQGLADFQIKPHHDLDLMEENQSVTDVTARVLVGVGDLLRRESPDWLIVQGDTSSAMAAAMAAFHHGVKIAHVEAGLRTGSLAEPWPEEMNRRLIAQMANLHLAPTQIARTNLESEGIPHDAITVCGNTVIDALVLAQGMGAEEDVVEGLDADLPLILCTMHRRENLSPDRLRQVEEALKILARDKVCQIVFPFHPNPALAGMVANLESFHPRLRMISPLRYVAFVNLMSKATMILTDSGGIQEEAAFLGKPVLIMRSCTERPEVLDGGAILVGTDRESIIGGVDEVLARSREARSAGAFMALGNGNASAIILETLLSQRVRSP